MKLPFIISLPHSGLTVPDEIKPIFLLNEQQIIEDSDEGASRIYALEACVEVFLSTHVPRAVIDLNRPPDDFSMDGVIKTHTCQMVPVYQKQPDAATITSLLENYYYPYHQALTRYAETHKNRCILALDCHTMLAVSPPVDKQPGIKRPRVCLSNAYGTCNTEWIEGMADCFIRHFGNSVTINDPFKGGYITRTHGREMPWIQIEISREPFMTDNEKNNHLIASLQDWISLFHH